ncbi:MAG: 10 kDa heat shock protein [Cyphobasidiales sp. Tagirdzhanova-0007]|nr:MAG: 10 kDa heat shock protein [Cyphobasidiales sp. Tagirdzhanova-0007]
MALSIKSIKSIVPLLDRVLIQRIQPKEKTASGLFLPTTATAAAPPEAEVLAVGPGSLDKEGKLIPMSVKIGDKVLLPPYGGQGIKVGDDEYFLFKDQEILAKLSE